MTDGGIPDALTYKNWRKSSRTGGGGGQCVEVGWCPGYVGIRDTKLGNSSPILTFTETSFKTFRDTIKVDQLD